MGRQQHKWKDRASDSGGTPDCGGTPDVLGGRAPYAFKALFGGGVGAPAGLGIKLTRPSKKSLGDFSDCTRRNWLKFCMQVRMVK